MIDSLIAYIFPYIEGKDGIDLLAFLFVLAFLYHAIRLFLALLSAKTTYRR
jgi:hypothetical protein